MIEYREYVRRAVTVLIILGMFVLLVLGISRVANLLMLIFTAWVIAVTLEVPVRLLQRLKLPRIAAVLVSILLLVVLGGAFIALVVPPFITQADALISDLPEAIRSAAENYVDLQEGSDIATRLLPPIDVSEIDALLQGDLTLVLPAFENLQGASVDIERLASTALPLLRQIGSFIASALANLFLIALLALLLLLEPTIYYRAIVSLAPKQQEARTLEILNMIRENVTNWLGAMLLSTGVTTVLFMLVLGVIINLPNPLALSLLAGLATFVPTFGPTVALIPIALVAAGEGIQALILTVILYAAVGVVQDRVVTPAIMKSELDIPAAGLVIFQLALAGIIGPLGLLLAVPILAILVTLVRELYVFDALGKAEQVPTITSNKHGQLAFAPAGEKKQERKGPRVKEPPEGE